MFLASLPLTTELVTALQIPINNSLLVVGVGGLQGVGGGEGVVTLQANSQVTTEVWEDIYRSSDSAGL